jgi:hypothetical protein
MESHHKCKHRRVRKQFLTSAWGGHLAELVKYLRSCLDCKHEWTQWEWEER